MRPIPLARRLDARSRLRIKELVPPLIARRMRPNHTRELRHPSGDLHPGTIPLYCVICTWHEGDIIHASVTDARAQGAERVVLIDNASPDDTVAEAHTAGAEVRLSYETDGFDETFKYALLNATIENLSRATQHDEIWWLLKDADEFTGAATGTIADFVARVDRRCRVVGARVLDHYPTPGVELEPRANPLAVQPRYLEKADGRCLAGHHKHPLFLWRRAGPRITVEPGFHQLRCTGEVLYEPDTSLVMHHHPYRNEEATRRRSQLLTERGLVGADERGVDHSHLQQRMRHLDAVYAGDTESIVDYRTGLAGVHLDEWTETAPIS